MTYDPGMDRSPDVWQNPEIDPNFDDIIPQVVTPDNDENPGGEVQFADAGLMHTESLAAIGKVSGAMERLIKVLSDVNKRIDRVDAGTTFSRSARLRVRWIIISRATAGDATLTVGTESFAFTVGAAPIRVDFPLVIENGTDIGFTGDGRIYLVSDPE